MKEKDAYLQFHDAYVENKFMCGKSRSVLTSHFCDYLKRVQGSVPATGIPISEFLTWSDMIPKPNDDLDTRSLMFRVNRAYSHFIWSFTKYSYVVEPEVWGHMINSEAPKILPSATLKQLPHWCQWIDAPIRAIRKDRATDTTFQLLSSGFWASYINYEKDTHLNLEVVGSLKINNVPHMMTLQIIFNVTNDIELIDGLDWNISLHDGQQGKHFGAGSEYGLALNALVNDFMAPTLNVLLFVASEVDNIYKGGVKQLKPRKQGINYKIIPVRDVREWRVGTELLNEIRAYDYAVSNCESQGRRPHIRRAHHHNYWYGPLDKERELKSRWVPPCFVRGTVPE
ncbi:MAG: hypothetical protein RR672_04745 [Raoultibacter sp.]